MQQPIAGQGQPRTQVEEVLEMFDGNALLALDAVISDCHHLHEQLRLAHAAMSSGYTRGWYPTDSSSRSQST